MTRFISFANRKGGTGKTTTAVNVSCGLAKKNKKVLLIDLDPQAHATVCLGISAGSHKINISKFLKTKISLQEALINTYLDNLQIISSCKDFFELEQINEFILLEKLSKSFDFYDYVIMDLPASFGSLTTMGLVASKEVYVPMQMHFLTLESLSEIMQLIYTINASWNKDLKLAGIIPTFFNKNTKLAQEILNKIKNIFGENKIFPEIRLNTSIAEAPSSGKSIFDYAPQSIGAFDYNLLVNKIANL